MEGKKIYAIIGIFIIPIIIGTGVMGLLIQSTHNTNSSTTDWVQYKLDCSYETAYNGAFYEHEYGDHPMYNWCDGYLLELYYSGSVTFRIPTSDLDFGLYRLILVMAIYDYNAYSLQGGTIAGPMNLAISIGNDVTTSLYYYYDDPCPPGPPGSDRSYVWYVEEVHPYPRDFGLIYFQEIAEDYHTINIYNQEDGAPNWYSCMLDEIILTPA